MDNKFTTNTVKELINKAGTIVHKSPDKCIEYATQALEISQNLKFPLGIGMSLMDIGLGNFYKGNYVTVIGYYSEALEIFRKNNFPPAVSQLLNNFGTLYIKLLETEKALECYLEAIDIDTKIGNKPNISLTLNNIGNIYSTTGNKKEALINYEKALSIAEESGFSYGINVTLTNIGKIYKNNKDYKTALKYFEKSKDLCLKTNKTQILVKTYSLLADIYKIQKEYVKSMEVLEQSLKDIREMKNKKEELSILTEISALDIINKDFEKAEKTLLKLEKDAILEDSRDHLKLIYFQLNLLYEKTGKYNLSLKYFRKFHKIQNEIFKKQNTEKLSILKIKFEVETKEKELKIIKQKNEELEQKVEEGIQNWKKQHQLLIQKSKLESLGKLAAGMAHEINQPLQGISLGLENIKNKAKMNKLSDEYISKKIDNFSENIVRIKKIIENIRIFSREQTSLEIDIYNVNEIINKALEVINLQFKKHNIFLDFKESKEKIFTLGNKYKLEQVIFNLISNARDAIENIGNNRKKEILISTEVINENAIIKVRDNGTGIPQENLDNVFNPFFTTKEPEKGTGLGLSIVYGIIKEINGDISMESEVNKFTEVTIKLPIVKEEGKIEDWKQEKLQN